MMQEKRNKRLMISLVILLSASAFVYFLLLVDRRPVVENNIFKIEELDQVDQIVLSSVSDTITLDYNGSHWKVNKLYDADRNMIDVLFATLQQAVPKRPISQSQQDSIAALLKTTGVKVELSIAGAHTKTFYAGGNSAKTQAYFMDPENGGIYLMTIPGYRVYVSGILEMDEGGWRDKYVFGFNWTNFKGLEVEFPERPANNYAVFRERDRFGITGIDQIDTARLNTFLDQVSLLEADRFLSDRIILDSLSKVKPLMVITVRDIASREFVLKVYIPDRTGEVPGLIADTQLAYFQRQKIQPLVRPKSFFVKNQ
jgi:hypothetical protein